MFYLEKEKEEEKEEKEEKERRGRRRKQPTNKPGRLIVFIL